jgi:hypothetical protein
MSMPAEVARRYQIVLRGECRGVLAGLFTDATIESHGGQTCVLATVRDQSEFYGMLDRFQDLALQIVSLSEVGS